jgi:dolichyl-phosphate-mannose-protein mannosyltransferase
VVLLSLEVSSSLIGKRLTSRVVTGSRAAVLGSGLATAAIVVAHLPSLLHRLLDGDEAIYGSMAVLMNLGGSLYADGGVDNKPPGIFWVYALTFRLFGAYSTPAVHAVALLVLVATCALIFLIARELSAAGAWDATRAGVLAALFYGVLTAAGNPRLLAANTELFMMLPLSASVLFMLRRRWFWSGALIAVAFAFRQSAAVNVLLLALGVFWLEPAPSRLRAMIGGAAGGIAALIVTAGLIALTGSLPGFWRWTIGTLVGYASNSWSPNVVLPRARDSLLPFVVDNAVVWIAAIVMSWRWRTVPPAIRLAVVWLGIAMLGSLAGGHLSWHYFIQAMGPLAVVAALAFASFRLPRIVTAAAIAGIAIPAVAWWTFDVGADPLTYDFSPPVPQHQTVSSYIAAHTSPSDRVFVWGDWPALYVESDRTMATRFPGFLRGFARGSGAPPNNWDVAPDVWPLLRSDFDAHPPALIVDTAPAGWSDFAGYPMAGYPVLAEIVARDYHQVDAVDGVVIYARNA